MYLKSIEVQGFKSFANKINFEFHNGITGIVGPNGSGKSNVADAVRWVLGEQRIRQLRGGKMEDVIFAGTENRKPLGYAYVSITLDNGDHELPTDFREVTVSRRLFRSGESEYMLNGTVCRLKDVNELFYDTGIGKEGYSIIGQGQIDKILSGRPEDRRELFDEAAGIVKFKRRKAEAVKRLESEKASLERISDILSELERQMKPLEKQSEKARKYLRLRDELKTSETIRFTTEIANIRSAAGELEEKLKIAHDEISEKNELFDNIKSRYEELDKFIEEINAVIDEKKNELNRVNLMKEKSDGEINVLKEQINSSKAGDEHGKSRKELINLGISEYMEELEKYRLEKEGLDSMLKNASSVRTEAEDRMAAITAEMTKLSEETEEAKNSIIGFLSEQSEINGKIGRYDTMEEQINLRKAELSQKIIRYESDREEQERIIKEIADELESMSVIIAELMKNKEELEAVLADLKSERAELFREQDSNRQKFHALNSNLEALKNITERYEGYGNSVKKVMELRETKKGIIGTVADIISVEKKYEIAVDTALGGNIQNIVTDTETVAKETIEYLKRGKFGRATFLPLNSIANKTGFANEKVFGEKGVIGLACDLVKIKKDWENIAKYLLGRIVVVDNIDNALHIAGKYNYTLRIVTLEGELLNVGGSLSGGAFKNSSSILGRKRELDELKSEIDKINLMQDDIKERMEKNRRDEAEKKTEYENLAMELSEKSILQNTLRNQLDAANGRKKELSDGYESINVERGGIAEQLNEIKENRARLDMELKVCDENRLELEKKVKDLGEALSVKKQEEAEELKNNEELRLKLSGLSQKKEFINENILRIKTGIEKLKEEMSGIDAALEKSGREIKEKTDEIEKIKISISEAEKHVIAIEEEIERFCGEREDRTAEHKDFFAKREEITAAISALDKEIFRLTGQREKVEENREKIINYMWEEYEVTYGDALKMADALTAGETEESDETWDKSEAAVKKRITDLKAEIRELGEVNVNSIEDYKETSERYTFMKTQHDDMLTANVALMKIIDELDKGMRARFNEKFEEIRLKFDNVFKELFGGGKGTIELTDDGENDVLEAGISIISQPPGKKLQNMMQLSGGEKSLTAIALLFAIQNLKPSPFCLLDEIEAALDDSNVVRFARYLHKLTNHTQFIVITHRRGTMAASDRLYGITMQEKGVSALVSVRLEDDQ